MDWIPIKSKLAKRIKYIEELEELYIDFIETYTASERTNINTYFKIKKEQYELMLDLLIENDSKGLEDFQRQLYNTKHPHAVQISGKHYTK